MSSRYDFGKQFQRIIIVIFIFAPYWLFIISAVNTFGFLRLVKVRKVILPNLQCCLAWVRSLQFIQRPTQRAPDAGDSAAISSSFLRLSNFLAGRLRHPRPSAGNANRWAAGAVTQNIFRVLWIQ